MARCDHPVGLVPQGLLMQMVAAAGATTEIVARSRQARGWCPRCGTASSKVHSRYIRRPGDLPLGGRTVRLVIQARRFVCNQAKCQQRIFAERFSGGIVLPWARRTARLEELVLHLGLALGGRPGARFADRLMAPVSNDTLLRSVRRRSRLTFPAPKVVGIDDWAWRRNHRYGTIICDLERRRPIQLLPDREPATAHRWLEQHRQIEIVSRDRGGGYGVAVTQALPHALQVADRWHLMENASQSLLDAARASMREIRAAVGTTVIDPELLTAAERIQYEGFLRRQETNSVIHTHSEAGLSMREIVRRTGHSRRFVRSVLRGQRQDVFRTRESSLDAWLPSLDARWSAGCRNGAALWRKLRGEGFEGSLRVVTEWATRRRRAEKAECLNRAPSARTVIRLLTVEPDDLSRAETVTVAAIQKGVPQLIEARDTIAEFHAMLRKRAVDTLSEWVEKARSTLISSFARGVARDIDAVRAAVAMPWSNGQTEGQITKLKLVKRQMYGRAKLDLLEARLLASAT